jgi:1,4-alpha-glucan branching enzyme
VLDKLDYLARSRHQLRRADAVKEFPGQSWGYNLPQPLCDREHLRPRADLARLIDELHGRGIRVVMDGVYNHADKDSPLAQIDYDYWFYNPNPDPPEMQWGPKYNYLKFDENCRCSRRGSTRSIPSAEWSTGSRRRHPLRRHAGDRQLRRAARAGEAG